jgi:hypothetical protein
MIVTSMGLKISSAFGSNILSMEADLRAWSMMKARCGQIYGMYWNMQDITASCRSAVKLQNNFLGNPQM